MCCLIFMTEENLTYKRGKNSKNIIRDNNKKNRNLRASRTDEGFLNGVSVSSRSVKQYILLHSNPFLSPAPPQGHAAPVLYAAWAETGYLKENELLNLRKVDSILEGHPVPVRQRQDLQECSVWRVIYSNESTQDWLRENIFNLMPPSCVLVSGVLMIVWQ